MQNHRCPTIDERRNAVRRLSSMGAKPEEIATRLNETETFVRQALAPKPEAEVKVIVRQGTPVHYFLLAQEGNKKVRVCDASLPGPVYRLANRIGFRITREVKVEVA